MVYPQRTQKLMHGVARWLMVIAVALSPWLFGSSHPWAYLLTGILLLLSCALCLLALLCCPLGSFKEPALTGALILLLMFVGLQAVPLPISLLEKLSPGSAASDLAARATVSQIEDAAEPVVLHASSLSVSPQATTESLFIFASCIAVFLVMTNCVVSWHQLRRMARVIAVLGFLMAVVAVVHKFSGDRGLLWLTPFADGGDSFGPFSNRNHFAFYMLMVFGMSMGLFLASGGFEEFYSLGEGERVAWLSTKRASRLGLLAFMIAIIGGSIVLTLSRGGIVSLLLGTAVATTIAAVRAWDEGKAKIIGSVVLLILALITMVGWAPILDRMGSLAEIAADPVANTRFQATVDTLKVAREFPVAGCGFGAFRHVFSTYSRPELHFGRWLHAHNDWAQLVAEGGMIGTGLFLTVVILFLRSIFVNFQPARVRPRRFALGCLLAVMAVSIHSTVDYALHKPANAFTLVFLCGLAVSAVRLHSARIPSDGEESAVLDAPPDSVEPSSMTNGPVKVLLCVMLASVTLGVVWGGGRLRAEMAFKRFEALGKLVGVIDTQSGKHLAIAGAREEAESSLNTSTVVPDEIRVISSKLGSWAVDRSLPIQLRTDLAVAAKRFSKEALASSPSDYLAWLRMAQASALLGEWDDADVYLQRARELTTNGENLSLFPDWR